ncbi:glycine-rich domain-containing protein [Streptomyces sp. NPDC088090]|uniref:glycine-rich domain-containing protein n=1 Tax=Streptomyces sp. NPDC088090 TaxID=3365822 RepID=UPI00384CB823
MATATPTALKTGRELVTPDLFGRLVNRIVKDEKIEPALAERIMSDTLGFLDACGNNPGAPLAPSELVDIGWHTFIVYTEPYADFCQRTAGRFIHHSPADEPGKTYEPKADTRLRAIEAMRRLGYTPDPELWGIGADCTQCHAGCSDSNYDGR